MLKEYAKNAQKIPKNTQKKSYPNNLKSLLKQAGLKQFEAATETNIPIGTLRHYLAGDQIIPNSARVSLAQLLGCSLQELEPQITMKSIATSAILEEDDYFSFGPVRTSTVVLDGDGVEVYLPEHIQTYYDPQPATFFNEVLKAKELVIKEQEEKQKKGLPFQWNGDKYHLSQIIITRDPVYEQNILKLWFKPRDHFTGLATRKCLKNEDFRKKYVPDDWSAPVVGMSCSLGINLAIITADNYIILSQRGAHQSVNQNMCHVAISEALSTHDRLSEDSGPDIYNCAMRGLTEELGLQEHQDFQRSDIQLLSFTADTQYALYGIQGMIKLQKTAKQVIQDWKSGVKDKMENKKIIAIPFNPQELCTYILSHESFTGYVCIYHTLVHEFGKKYINSLLNQ